MQLEFTIWFDATLLHDLDLRSEFFFCQSDAAIESIVLLGDGVLVLLGYPARHYALHVLKEIPVTYPDVFLVHYLTFVLKEIPVTYPDVFLVHYLTLLPCTHDISSLVAHKIYVALDTAVPLSFDFFCLLLIVPTYLQLLFLADFGPISFLLQQNLFYTLTVFLQKPRRSFEGILMPPSMAGVAFTDSVQLVPPYATVSSAVDV
jgi:hypothetical protein